MVKSDLIKVNEKLEHDIASRIPEGYSNLEKALFTYYELCKKLNYSLEYFLNNPKAHEWFTDVKNLEKVDGEKFTEVVCFTFNPIFAKMLINLGICDESILARIEIDENGRFSEKHIPLVLNIDGFNYLVDSSKGVFDNKDLTLAKYSTHKISGWTPEAFVSDSATFMLRNSLNSAIEKVQSDNQELETNVNAYLCSKMLDNSYEELSLDDRVKIFLIAVHTCPDYGVLAFNYLLKLKRKLFSNDELGKGALAHTKIDLFFGKNIESNRFEAFLLYNPKGYVDEFGLENFDSLNIFQISVKDKKTAPIALDQFKQKITSCSVVTRGTERNEYTSGMTIPGKLKLTPVFEGNDPSKKIIGYIRTFKNGKTEQLSVEQAEKLKATQSNTTPAASEGVKRTNKN